MRLNNQIEYTPLKITLLVNNNVTTEFFSHIPKIINNSPIKLAVPGKPIFAIEKLKKKKTHIGKIKFNPP